MKIEEYIAKRRKELEAELKPALDERGKLDGKIKKLNDELAKLEQAAAAVGLEAPKGMSVPLLAEPRKIPEFTIKDAVLKVLDDQPSGLTALEILAKINERFDLNLVRTSLSPQLSRLKMTTKR